MSTDELTKIAQEYYPTYEWNLPLDLGKGISLISDSTRKHILLINSEGVLFLSVQEKHDFRKENHESHH